MLTLPSFRGLLSRAGLPRGVASDRARDTSGPKWRKRHHFGPLVSFRQAHHRSFRHAGAGRQPRPAGVARARLSMPGLGLRPGRCTHRWVNWVWFADRTFGLGLRQASKVLTRRTRRRHESTERKLMRFARCWITRPREAPKFLVSRAFSVSPCLRGKTLLACGRCAPPGGRCRASRPVDQRREMAESRGAFAARRRAIPAARHGPNGQPIGPLV